ncbi:MAG: nucleoid-associated protein [Sphingobacteriaceae bacterium]|nr:nucleoid-associated protein [Sphingobacteriaceae bacterium]
MIQLDQAKIDKLIYHRLFDEEGGEPDLNEAPYFRENAEEEEVLKRIFLKPFAQTAATFEFMHEVELKLNPLYSLSKGLENGRDFTETSQLICKHLHQVSRHPAIPGGDLFIIAFQDVQMGNAVYNALGIYKIENKDFFLETAEVITGTPGLRIKQGIGGKRFDKACLVLFTEEEAYTVLMMEKAGSETDYWQRAFIGLKSKQDDVNHTNGFLTLTKNFVTQQYPEEFVVSRADQIDLLNRSVDFFKKHEQFDKQEFENEVLQDAEVIKSFHDYNKQFQRENEWQLADQFDISAIAVKKQQRIFKSVLKLDKNFHIYIHGNRELIEQGTDPDGRKFYKIYYDNEA